MIYISTLPYFVAYLAIAVGLLLVFLFLYMRITPHPEFELIRAGNNATAITLAGALLGFVIPLASNIAHSQNIPDMLVWGVVAMAVQIAIVVVVKLTAPQLYQRVDDGQTATAVLLAAISVCVGILNAACMTY
jgi:putative membrane protein